MKVLQAPVAPERQRMNIAGVVLELPKRVRRDPGGQLARGEVIYVYASQISAAGE